MVVAAVAAIVVVAVVDFHRIGSIRHLSLNTNCLLSVLYCLLLFLYTLYTHTYYMYMPHYVQMRVYSDLDFALFFVRLVI